MTMYLNHKAGRLRPWVSQAEADRDPSGETRASEGTLVVLKVAGDGSRTIVVQRGHPISGDLAMGLGARIRVPKRLR